MLLVRPYSQDILPALSPRSTHAAFEERSAKLAEVGEERVDVYQEPSVSHTHTHTQHKIFCREIHPNSGTQHAPEPYLTT